MSISLIDLYNRAENYFFRTISKKYLDINGNVFAYMTGVSDNYLNIICVKEKSFSVNNLDRNGKKFFNHHNLPYTINIPDKYCTSNIIISLTNKGYIKIDQSEAMVNKIESYSDHELNDNFKVKFNNNNLLEWMIPLKSAFELSYENVLQYTKLHIKAVARKKSFYHFTAYEKEKPVSSVTLSINNNIARIDDVTTVKEFQRRGYPTYLMRYVLSKAKSLGACYCFLEAAEQGLSLYRKLGFKTLYKNNIFSPN